MNAGASAHQETYAEGFGAGRNGVKVKARRGGRRLVYRGHLVVGADGVNSVVARSAGLLAEDPRHIAVSQRAYADGFERDIGEATFFFDRDFFPGYGWVFPMSGGRVNLGVGVLLETCRREDIKVPQLFRDFLEKAKRSHPGCGKLRLSKPPIGGIVKTYGGAGPNYFNRGLLIGDAGSFVDPMTGEGITPAMESALIAARVILEGFAAGRFDADSMSSYESEYRRYFDPSMIFLDLCAATLRNKRLCESWNRALVRGCQLAQKDADFAQTTGACFGGLEISPSGILSQLWAHMACDLLAAGPQSVLEFVVGGASSGSFTLQEMAGWMGNWWASVWDDPLWHARWTLDVQRKWIQTLSIMRRNSGDPRTEGLA